MAIAQVAEYLKLVPTLRRTPTGHLSWSYDAEADALYISFKTPSHATDSELTDDDVIVRYEGDEVVGLTILHASQR
ncbi:MAG: DUF2283 domain-containing protein [Chloroflexi bacterium]|nr:DUF2283 domain-containing protein [Chloroflexota bacterium]MBI4507427.1 DUF2283 domain-containing protein [Chloroflexota bacterium]